MYYIVWDGNSSYYEADDLQDALDCAKWSLEAADDFARRKGWTPFWSDLVEIRLIKAKDFSRYNRPAWEDVAGE